MLKSIWGEIMINYNNDLSDDSKWIISENINRAMPFYVTELGKFKCGKQYFTERQDMPSYLLILTLSGKGSLSCGGRTITLAENSAALIDCSGYHKYKTADDSWEFLWMHIGGNGVKPFYSLFNADINGKSEINIHGNIIQDFLYIELLSSRTDVLSSIQISNAVSDILSSLLTMRLSENSGAPRSGSHYKDILTVVEYIHSNYQDNINLNDMTELVNISKYHFIRLFKEQIGTTPYEYILNYRMLCAKKLLRTTSMSVGEISVNVGFSSVSNFIQKFKAIEGISPSAYRKETIF